MKIIKFLLKPLKYIVFLALFFAIIYYRAGIFHSNVNHYIDMAEFQIEDRFDIDIPSYNFSSYVSAENKLDGPVLLAEQDVSIVNEVNNSADEESIIEESEEVVNDDVVDNTQVVEVNEVVEPVILENPMKQESDVINEGSNINVINELTNALDKINHKVDLLFDMQKPTAVTQPEISNNSASSDQLAMINSQQEKARADDSSSIEPTESKDVKQMISMARQSFWNGNAQLSEKFYLDLAKSEDADPDVYGELGNVYYAQGKWKQAGKAYYEAAIRLLELKQGGQVGYLLRVIQGLDAESAEKLRQKMSG